MARDGETLLVKAEVRDDQHVRPHSGEKVWKGDNIQLGLVLPWQNVWEIGLTRLESEKNEVHIGMAQQSIRREAVAAKIALKTSRDERIKETVYEARIPFEAVGLTGSGGFQFNLLVNDNDGPDRESRIAIAPGIPEKDTSRYPVTNF